MRGITVRWRRSRATKDSRTASKKTTHRKGVRNSSDKVASSESKRVSTGLGPSLAPSEPKQLVVIERTKAEQSPPEPLGALPVIGARVSETVYTRSRTQRREGKQEVGNKPRPPPEPPDQNVTGERDGEADKKRRWKVRGPWSPPSTSRPPDAVTAAGERPNRHTFSLEQTWVREVRSEDTEKSARIPSWPESVELDLTLNWVLGFSSILMGQAQITLGKKKMRSQGVPISTLNPPEPDPNVQERNAPSSPLLMRASFLWVQPPKRVSLFLLSAGSLTLTMGWLLMKPPWVSVSFYGCTNFSGNDVTLGKKHARRVLRHCTYPLLSNGDWFKNASPKSIVVHRKECGPLNEFVKNVLIELKSAQFLFDKMHVRDSTDKDVVVWGHTENNPCGVASELECVWKEQIIDAYDVWQWLPNILTPVHFDDASITTLPAKTAMRCYLLTHVNGMKICTWGVILYLKHQIHIDCGHWVQAHSGLPRQLEQPKIHQGYSDVNGLVMLSMNGITWVYDRWLGNTHVAAVDILSSEFVILLILTQWALSADSPTLRCFCMPLLLLSGGFEDVTCNNSCRTSYWCVGKMAFSFTYMLGRPWDSTFQHQQVMFRTWAEINVLELTQRKRIKEVRGLLFVMTRYLHQQPILSYKSHTGGTAVCGGLILGSNLSTIIFIFESP